MSHYPFKDLRKEPRLAVSHPVKVWCPMTQKYLAGRTRNLSCSGALLELDHSSLLVPGQRVCLGIDSSGHQPLLRSKDMLQATIVRSLGMGFGQTVALTFDQRVALAASA